MRVIFPSDKVNFEIHKGTKALYDWVSLNLAQYIWDFPVLEFRNVNSIILCEVYPFLRCLNVFNNNF